MTERPKRVVLRISVFFCTGFIRIRHIRKRVDRRMDKAGDTGDYGDRGTEEDKEFVPEGERYDIIYECVHIVWLL